MAFETVNSVCLDLAPSRGSKCLPNAALPSEVWLTVENVAENKFQAHLKTKSEEALADVNLRTYPGGSVAYWLHGKTVISGVAFDAYIYLLDEPQASSDIYKHYRIELFDTSCHDQPQFGTNYWAKSIKHPCTGNPTKSMTKEQTGSGDGYEPRK